MTQGTDTMNAKKTIAAALAAAMLAAAALPAGALPAPYLTPDTTVAQMRANEGIAGSGFDTWDRGSLFPEQPWQYGDWTLRRFVGATVDDAVFGLNLVIQNYNHDIQVTYPLYTEEEIAADPSKKGVELYYFPGEQSNGKYALVLCGNMLERTSRIKESCGAVSQLHKMGYTAFILKYRVGHEISRNGNYNDLVRAVEYITENADVFHVRPEQYALVGFSAGAHLCGIFGTDRMGYKRYDLPKPGALLLAYPIVNYMYGKPGFLYVYDGAEPGDDLAPGDYYYNIELNAEVTPDFPPTFHWFGRNDLTLGMIFPPLQGPALDRALEQCGVEHKMVVYGRAPHGSGTGTGTDAAGWLYDAVDFWEEVTAQQ